MSWIRLTPVFRDQLTALRNLYSFLSQIVPYQDADLEKLHVFVRFLIPKLPRRAAAEQYRSDDNVTLKHHRLEKISEGEIGLRARENGTVAGPVAVGTGAARDDRVELSMLIGLINDRFGTQFTMADELFFEQVREEAASDETVQVAALANSLENFRHVFDGARQGMFVGRMEQN